jgi:hypothetical protein
LIIAENTFTMDAHVIDAAIEEQNFTSATYDCPTTEADVAECTDCLADLSI